MKIICPECLAEYEVDESMADAKVQCANCKHKWVISDGEKKSKFGYHNSDIDSCRDMVISDLWDSVKIFICANLKAPLTAVFSDAGQPESIVYLGGQCFEINSTVDSQNSYGALVRNYFTAIVYYGKSGISPILVKIQEERNVHEIKPKEIKCLICRKMFFHDTSFEPETLLCPFCGKETTYMDLSPWGCFQKIVISIIAIFVILVLLYGFYAFVAM